MSKGGRVVEQQLPASLKDMVSIAIDLDFVERACEQLLQEDKRPQPDTRILVQALWISAVVVYARCFGQAKRAALDDKVLAALPDQERATHDQIWRERNKYVAHVELTREEITAMERVVRMSTNEVLGTQVMFRRFTHDPDQVRRLVELTRAVRAIVAPKLDAEVRAFAASLGRPKGVCQTKTRERSGSSTSDNCLTRQ